MKTILRLIALLALSASVCFSQGTGGGITIETQSGGVTNGTFKRFFVLNCVSGLTCSVSGSTLSINTGTVSGLDTTGVSDSGPALNTFFAACAAPGCTARLLPGTYNISTTLTLPVEVPVTLTGSGQGTVLKCNVDPIGQTHKD